jgi:translocation and assembly module TamB
MRRRLLYSLLALAALLLVASAALPLWLGVALRWFGPSRGLTYTRYERLPDSRFALHGVEFQRGNVRVTAARIEADTPALWLWRHSRAHPTLIAAENWQVEIRPRAAGAPAPPPRPEAGWVLLHAQLRRIGAQLERWLPQAQLGAGRVRWPGGEIAAAAARWANRELTVRGLGFRALRADGVVTIPAEPDVLRLALTLEEGTALSLESRGAEVSARLVYAAQPAIIDAQFGARGWLPLTAAVRAEHWALPGSRLKLGESYAQVRGDARLEWRDGRFRADVTATGEPLAGRKTPPLTLALRGGGDLQAFTVEALEAALPGISAKLSAPVTIDRGGNFTGAGAVFSVRANLAEQPWLKASGTVEGEARLAAAIGSGATAGKIPRVEFELRAREVRAAGVALTTLGAQGSLLWPRLLLERAEIVGGEGERLVASGGWDFQAKEILPARIEGQIRRASLARWLPTQPEFDVVTLRAEAAGAPADIPHRGQAEASGVKVKGLNPLQVALDWSGRGASVDTLALRVTAGGTQLAAAGSLSRDALRLERLELARGGAPLLALVQPAALRWRPALALEGLHLAGGDATLDAKLSWGAAGRIELAARNLRSAWLADLVPERGPEWSVGLLALTGTWDHGPMEFALTSAATISLGENRTASVNLAARGSRRGLHLEALRATEGAATVLNATGELPVLFQPGTQPALRIEEDGAVRFDASAAPNAQFWQQLAALSGVELQNPAAWLKIGGTWSQPRGDVQLKADRVAFDPKRFTREIPAITGLDVQISAEPAGLALRRFTVAIEGQPVRVTGRLPVAEGRWRELTRQPATGLQREAELKLEIPEAEVAVFARFLPSFLAAQGRVQADVTYRNGALGGFVRLRDAASRPLGPLGVLQEINAELALAGRRIELRDVSAKSGGQPVALAGVVELPEPGSAARAGAPWLPRYDLALRGENLPFVRQTGLLVRGDLDLKLQTQSDPKVAKISGVVNLRDSLFLQDVRAFLPKGGGGGGAKRPPYFSVNTPPLNTWPLAVEVTGERFLRLRMPVFSGVASAHFRLGGTLGEPRAIGEAAIDEGRVQMPFASFEVKQGAVRLTESNPYEPAIYVRATGRRYGYDLTLEIDGAASAPNVEFSSSPALDSEQVLLMVMTGAAPQNEINKSATQRAAGLGTFLGRSLLSSVSGETGGADRLSIESGEKISRQGRETYDIEYKLSDRWALTGEYNEFDEYNAGLKWRVAPRQTEEERRAAAARKAREAPPKISGDEHARD